MNYSSIIYIIPYFGKMRDDFPLWLKSCEYNPTVNWLIFTDDKTEYNYPSNVKVIYTSFEIIKERIQSIFEFKITLDKPYKLCEYKVTYGEAFSAEIDGYDFWGYCDMDLIWGNIRNILTEDILRNYEKIGFQGHSTLFRNTMENNSRRRSSVYDYFKLKEIFTSPRNFAFDEKGINEIYGLLGIRVYSETNFATLAVCRPNFITRYVPRTEKKQIFVWEKGNLTAYYSEEKQVKQKQMMYVHWQKRKMNIDDNWGKDIPLLIVPNCVKPYLNERIDNKFIRERNKAYWIRYFWEILKLHKGKGLIYRLKWLKGMVKYNWMVITKNESKVKYHV